MAVKDKLVTVEGLGAAYNNLETLLDSAIISDSTARTLVTGSSSYSVTGLTSDYVVCCWQFSGGYTENYPPGDITLTTSNGSYSITVSNLVASGITMKPIFIKP